MERFLPCTTLIQHCRAKSAGRQVLAESGRGTTWRGQDDCTEWSLWIARHGGHMNNAPQVYSIIGHMWMFSDTTGESHLLYPPSCRSRARPLLTAQNILGLKSKHRPGSKSTLYLLKRPMIRNMYAHISDMYVCNWRILTKHHHIASPPRPASITIYAAARSFRTNKIKNFISLLYARPLHKQKHEYPDRSHKDYTNCHTVDIIVYIVSFTSAWPRPVTR